ncbi:hypothetical protein H0H87_007917 [Tephrocybe sp. NHM501043]|nr:hypothetical protein H0H87_007917 [Tephrocybe sp. NHM501043]
MNTTSRNNYHSNGDDIHRHNRYRSSTAPAAAFPVHPTALMPGQNPQPTARSNIPYTDASRRMSIANDIRNAHNIPRAPPPLPLYPPQLAAEFQPRPPPPIPAATPPPPRPPFPPSLSNSVHLRPTVAITPPPIPPKPFATPFQAQGDGRPQANASTIPRALLPGGQPIPENDDSDMAMAMALSASVSNDEQTLRQKLVTQEEEDFAKALEASMLETRISDRSGAYTYASSTSNQSAPATSQSALKSQGDNHICEEAFTRSLATASSSTDSSHTCTSKNTFRGDSACVGTKLLQRPPPKQEAPSLSVLTSDLKQPVSSTITDAALPGYSFGDNGQSNALAPASARELSSPLADGSASSTPPTDNGPEPPSTPSDLAYLHHRDEHDGDVTPRVDKPSLARHLNSFAASSTTYPWQPPDPTLMRNLSVPSPVVTTSNERHETLKAAPPDATPLKTKEALSSQATASGLPKYSPQPEELPSSSSSVKSDLIYSYSHQQTTPSGGAPVAGPSKTTYSDALPPSYTEMPSPPAGQSPKPNTTQDFEPTLPQSNKAQSSSLPSSSASASSSVHSHFSSPAEAGGPLSRVSSAHSSLNDYDDNLDSARPAANHHSVSSNAFVNRELFNGLCPSWRHLLKLMASLSGTRMEPALDAVAVTKSAPKLRTVIQFVKPHHASPAWRTIFYFTIDYPPPQPQARSRSVSELPYSYSLAGVPTLLREASDSAVSKTYTIPATTLVPYPTLPITFPDLAMYLQAALDESRRYLNDNHSDYRKLAKMITTCYPDEDVLYEQTERRGLFQRVMGRSSKAPRRGRNEDTYELVTPFVPDEWG